MSCCFSWLTREFSNSPEYTQAPARSDESLLEELRFTTAHFIDALKEVQKYPEGATKKKLLKAGEAVLKIKDLGRRNNSLEDAKTMVRGLCGQVDLSEPWTRVAPLDIVGYNIDLGYIRNSYWWSDDHKKAWQECVSNPKRHAGLKVYLTAYIYKCLDEVNHYMPRENESDPTFLRPYQASLLRLLDATPRRFS